MAFSLFGNKKNSGSPQPDDTPSQAPSGGERIVRPMEKGDIRDVVAIITQHDEDDGAEARDDFEDSLDGMYVAVDNGRIVGVTGAIQDEEANDDVFWLSWTYVDSASRRQGIGRYLVGGLLDMLQDSGARKIFISTGSYLEDGEDIYGAAKSFYKRLGARQEMKTANYWPEEDRYVYGLDITDPGSVRAAPQSGHLIFDGLYEAPESDDGLVLTWSEFEPGNTEEDPAGALQSLVDEARSNKMRFVTAAIPADLSEGASQGLKAMGFSPAGELKDYYAPGIDQLHWMLFLDSAV